MNGHGHIHERGENANIHQVEPSNHFVKRQANSERESGWWKLSEDEAKKLVVEGFL